MRAFIANKEQEAMLERLKATTSRFDDHAPLRANADAIEAARTLIGEAAALQMPPVSYAGLQIYVSIYDTEMGLPEHLRSVPTGARQLSSLEENASVRYGFHGR